MKRTSEGCTRRQDQKEEAGRFMPSERGGEASSVGGLRMRLAEHKSVDADTDVSSSTAEIMSGHPDVRPGELPAVFIYSSLPTSRVLYKLSSEHGPRSRRHSRTKMQRCALTTVHRIMRRPEWRTRMGWTGS